MAERRVIFVNRVYWPATAATAQLLTDLAEGLAARGWAVEVIAGGDGPARQKGVLIHRTGGIDRHRGLLSQSINYGRFRRAAQRLLKTLVKPGDVIVPMTDPPLLGTAVTEIVNARGGAVVPWIQDIYPEVLSAHVGAWSASLLSPLRHQRNRAWQAARGCVTLGEDMAQTIRNGGVPAHRVTLIPNWAPRELHAPAPAGDIAARRQAWGVADKFVVAYSGNLGRVHEFEAALDAAAQLRDRPDIVFLFIGTGARFDAVRAAAASRKLDNVRLLPPESRENLPAALAAADAHLVTLKAPFAHLVFPSKLAGVLAAGRPVLFIGPADSEIARLVADERCGVAFSPRDGARLAATISSWRAEPAACAQFGRNGRAIYERQFTFEAALARWESRLREVAAEVQLPKPGANG